MNVQSNRHYGHIVGAVDAIIPIHNMEKQRIRSYVLLAFSDVVTIAFAFLAANFIYLEQWSATHGVTMMTVIVPAYLWIATITGAYNGSVLHDPRNGALKAVRAMAFAAGTMLIIAYSFKVGAAFSRFIFWTGTIASISLLGGGRLLLGRVLLHVLGGAPFSTVVLVDGVEWQADPHSVVIDAQQIGFDPHTDDPLDYHQLATLIAHADRVLIACDDDKTVAWAHVLKCMAVDGEILTPDVDRIGMIGVSRYRDRQTLVVSAGPLHLRDRLTKRTFDIVVSATVLLVLSPFLLALALAIRIGSPGPALFRQQRIGRDNTLFMMFKFRSMYEDRCDKTASILTTRADSRVTRIGRFMRRNSLDELPQLLNVLRGEMSMVGPRPHALSARADERLYWEIDARYRHRHAVKPGVTGLAQIRGFRGATVFAADLTNRLSSDLEYLTGWSMGKDIRILLKTLFVIRHHNAF